MSNPVWFAYRTNSLEARIVGATQAGNPVSQDVATIEVPRAVRQSYPNLADELALVVQQHLQERYGSIFPVIGR